MTTNMSMSDARNCGTETMQLQEPHRKHLERRVPRVHRQQLQEEDLHEEDEQLLADNVDRAQTRQQPAKTAEENKRKMP